MSLKKFGTGEILPEADDIKKSAATEQDKEKVLAEVREEQEQQEADKE